MDSYISYCNVVFDFYLVFEIDMSVKVEMGLGDRKGSNGFLEEWYDQDKFEVFFFFQFLQIFIVCFGLFVYGGNDVSNVIGFLVVLYLVYDIGDVFLKVVILIWFLFYGGVGICVGLWVWGRRVIQIMGKDLILIIFFSGFSIELVFVFIVVIVLNIGFFISIIYCKVGFVVFVGWFWFKKVVDWCFFCNIFMVWFVIVFIFGVISVVIMVIFRYVIFRM